MTELKDLILEELKNLDVSRSKIENETQFEDLVYKKLDTLLNNYDRTLLLKRQETSNRESRQLIPDIIVGRYDILIELKYDLKNLNDIYRLFYQAIKYSRLAKETLILLIYDPHKELTREDITDLERCNNVKVVRII